TPRAASWSRTTRSRMRSRRRRTDVVSSLYASRRDADTSPLRRILEIITEQLERLEHDVTRSYEEWFVETDDEWAVPYLGDLVEVAIGDAARGDTEVALERFARAGVARFEDDVLSIAQDWWPHGHAEEALNLRWAVGAVAAVRDERFVEAAYRALRGRWHAFRGARVTRETFERAIRASEPALRTLEPVTIADFERDAHMPALLDVFRAVEAVKPTNAKWVATSKTLYFLLPDLVPPIDNRFTIPFLRRSGIRVPPELEPGTLRAAFTVFSSLARLAGRERLERLSRRYGTPIGMARVVDFAIAARITSRSGGREPRPATHAG
ncbi:MAG TPA: hypothetical protein VG709_03300, partial [Actinomycetota bacterium]|nr:hypothetical protein [Actinomycetota bacterium]